MGEKLYMYIDFWAERARPDYKRRKIGGFITVAISSKGNLADDISLGEARFTTRVRKLISTLHHFFIIYLDFGVSGDKKRCSDLSSTDREFLQLFQFSIFLFFCH